MDNIEAYRSTMEEWVKHLASEPKADARTIHAGCAHLLYECVHANWYMLDEEQKVLAERDVDAVYFRPGLYAHYKGGLYTATGLGTHHQSRRPMVIYMSHAYGGVELRALRPHPNDPDGWNDAIQVGATRRPRFRWVGRLPSDVPMADRMTPGAEG